MTRAGALAANRRDPEFPAHARAGRANTAEAIRAVSTGGIWRPRTRPSTTGLPSPADDHGATSPSPTRVPACADHARLPVSCARDTRDAPPRSARLHPAHICVAPVPDIQSSVPGRAPLSARLVWHLNLVLTGADISEPADLGRDPVIMHPPGTAIMGTAGRNLTVMACAGIGRTRTSR